MNSHTTERSLQMKKSYLLMTVLLAMAGSFSSSTYAATGVASGKVLLLYTDPSDVVVELDTAGSCGSKYFHIQRKNANFKELTALVMTAASSGKVLNLFVASCVGDRNILSHGAMVIN